MPRLIDMISYDSFDRPSPLVADILRLVEEVLEFAADHTVAVPEKPLASRLDHVISQLLNEMQRDFYTLCIPRTCFKNVRNDCADGRPVEVVGKPGVGKTTLILQLRKAIRDDKKLAIYLDLNRHEQAFRHCLDLPKDKLEAEVSTILEDLLLERLENELSKHVHKRYESPLEAWEDKQLDVLSNLSKEEILDYLHKKNLFDRGNHLDFAHEDLGSHYGAIVYCVDNLDQLPIRVQEAAIQSCLSLNLRLDATVVFTIRDVNLRRHTSENPGSVWLHKEPVEGDIAMTRGKPATKKAKDLSIHLLSTSDEEIKALIGNRLSYLLDRRYIERYFEAVHGLDTNDFRGMISRSIHVLNKVSDFLIEDCKLVEASNDSVRTCLLMVNGLFKRVVCDQLYERKYRYVERYISLGVKDRAFSTEPGADSPGAVLTVVLKAIIDSGRARTLFYRLLIDKANFIPNGLVRQHSIWREEPRQGFFLFPTIAVLQYLYHASSDSYDARIPLQDLLDHMSIFGYSRAQVFELVRILSSAGVDEHKLGLVWHDWMETGQTNVSLYLNPTGAFFLSHLAVSLEYFFWSVVFYDWPEEIISQARNAIGPTHCEDGPQKLRVCTFLANKILKESFNLEIGHVKREGLRVPYRAIHIKRLPNDERSEAQHFLERVFRNSLTFVRQAHGDRLLARDTEDLAEYFSVVVGTV